MIGASWEGFVIEDLLAVAPEGARGCCYWTSGGAEIDLLLDVPKRGLWATEIKRSLAPRPDRGLRSACDDLEPAQQLIVYPGMDSCHVSEDVLVTSLLGAARLLYES